MSLNSISITGRLTDDPALRYAADGTPFATFSLAHNPRPRGGEEQPAIFVDVITFGARAEAIGEHLAKGRKVAVGGRLDADHWTDEAGKKRSKLKIVAFEVEFLDQPRPVADDAA